MADPFAPRQAETVKDTDATAESPHHTLGAGPMQAAAGNHSHTRPLVGSSSLTTDGSGEGTIDTGIDINIGVVISNGDYGNHAANPEVKSWSGTSFTFTNCLATTAIVINWVVA